jgi:hypothetical protein
MSDAASSVLSAWSNFYVMTGSSAAALIGLMFVVIALVTGMEREGSTDGTATFSTPTVVYFSSALLVSAVLVAPWPSLLGPAIVLGLAGACGLVYTIRVLFRAKRLAAYRPDAEDWAFYTVFPLLAYLSILVGATTLRALPEQAPFVLALGVVSLLFIGIHNAWDVVTYIVIVKRKDPPDSSAP